MTGQSWLRYILGNKSRREKFEGEIRKKNEQNLQYIVLDPRNDPKTRKFGCIRGPNLVRTKSVLFLEVIWCISEGTEES